jgi:hypothetical protein
MRVGDYVKTLQLLESAVSISGQWLRVSRLVFPSDLNYCGWCISSSVMVFQKYIVGPFTLPQAEM